MYPHWRSTMEEEYVALLCNQTWLLVPITPMNIVGCRWVFKVKSKVDGSIKRHETCLIAKHFNQKEGLDYDEHSVPLSSHPLLGSFLPCMFVVVGR